jgi:hypothetical protein
VGCTFHLVYMVIVFMYTSVVYVHNTPNMEPSDSTYHEDDNVHYSPEQQEKGKKLQRIYNAILACAVIYPCLYEAA